MKSFFFQVDEKSKRHGGELVASVLKAHDVEEIFVLCGGHISPILVAAEKLGIKIVDTRHEVQELAEKTREREMSVQNALY